MRMSLQKAERLFRRGMRHHASGQLWEALRLYRMILNEHPSYAPALHHAALATQKVRKHAKANGIDFDEKHELRLIVHAVESASRIAEAAEGANPTAFWGTEGPFAHGRLAFAA